MKPALLMIDLQKAYYDSNPYAQPWMDQAIRYMNAAASLFRKAGHPVIVIQHKEEAESFVPGCPGFEFHPALSIATTDIHIIKAYPSAFKQTNLEDTLSVLEVDCCVLTGIAAEYCVLATYYSALERGFNPIYLHSAVAPMQPNVMDAIYQFVESMTFSVLEKIIVPCK